MHRFVLLIVGALGSVKADVDFRQCFETAVSNLGCCQLNMTDENAVLIEECARTTVPSSQSCDFENCLAKKTGYLLPNGTIVKPLLEANIEKNFENYTDVMEIVKEKCLIDNIADYGPPHMCLMRKIVNCIHLYTVLNCPQWEVTEHCDKVRDKLDECESVFSQTAYN